ncbi:hypothetical protein HDV00_001206 [Rhizophlyctis rosea]|nr:hypothetical protein HDV00_001206 [Rhizophlyctis rosea]
MIISKAEIITQHHDQVVRQLLNVVIDCPFELARKAATTTFLRFLSPKTDLASYGVDLENVAAQLLAEPQTLARLRGASVWGLLASTSAEDNIVPQLVDRLSSLAPEAKSHLSSNAAAMHGTVEALASVYTPSRSSQSQSFLTKSVINTLIPDLFTVIEIAKSYLQQIRHFEDTGAEADDDEGDEATSSENGLTTGGLIACCWRTVKIGVGLLVDLVTNEMGTNIRHWGLANAVQQSLTRLCGALLKSGEGELVNLPKLWMEAALSSLDRMDVTRHDERYAGAPKILLSVLYATDRSARPEVVNKVFERVRSIADGSADLAAKVMLVALKGMESKPSAYRYAGTVLFTNLSARFVPTDGGQSGKIHTIESFCSAYSSVWPIMEDIVARPESRTHTPPHALFPILLLLSKLERALPQKFQGPYPNYSKVLQHVPNIACSSPLAAIREIASNCLVHLTLQKDLDKLIDDMCKDGGRPRTNNSLHGHLLIISHIISRLQQPLINDRPLKFAGLTTISTYLLNHTAQYLHSTIHNMIRALYCNILGTMINANALEQDSLRPLNLHLRSLKQTLAKSQSASMMPAWDVFAAAAVKLILTTAVHGGNDADVIAHFKDFIGSEMEGVRCSALSWCLEFWNGISTVAQQDISQITLQRLISTSTKDIHLASFIELLTRGLAHLEDRSDDVQSFVTHLLVQEPTGKSSLMKAAMRAVRTLLSQHSGKVQPLLVEAFIDRLEFCVNVVGLQAADYREVALAALNGFRSEPSLPSASLLKIYAIMLRLLKDEDDDVAKQVATIASRWFNSSGQSSEIGYHRAVDRVIERIGGLQSVGLERIVETLSSVLGLDSGPNDLGKRSYPEVAVMVAIRRLKAERKQKEGDGLSKAIERLEQMSVGMGSEEVLSLLYVS